MPPRSTQDLAQAEDWTTKAMGTRKANEAKKNQGPGGITMDEAARCTRSLTT